MRWRAPGVDGAAAASSHPGLLRQPGAAEAKEARPTRLVAQDSVVYTVNMLTPFAAAVLAFVHLAGVVLSFGGLFERWRGLSAFAASEDDDDEARALRGDNLWGVSALIVMPTGLLRLMLWGKGTSFYLANPFMHAKLTLLILLLALEVWPMTHLLRHRLAQARQPDVRLSPQRARLFARLSAVQLACLTGLLFCAPMMARGIAQMAG